MTRQELATEIISLVKSGELVSVMEYAYNNRKSRTWAEKQLSDESRFIQIPIEHRVYYLKK